MSRTGSEANGSVDNIRNAFPQSRIIDGARMTIIPIAQYPFEGPHRSVKKIENIPGLFAVICKFVDTFYLLDVDYSDDVKKAILDHERRACWEKYRRGNIRYAVLYEQNFPSEAEEEIEKKIRHRYKKIPCGSLARDVG